MAEERIIIGSKKFTESYVLAEIAKRTLENDGVPAEHRQGMGGTIVLWEALRSGQIGFYPDYTWDDQRRDSEIISVDLRLRKCTLGSRSLESA
jgi:glycine betaine/choline ABC-type transport system substrate-binding protein